MRRPSFYGRGVTLFALLACTALGALVAGALYWLRVEEQPRQRRTLEVGHHRVTLAVPAGWEHLDHGRQQLFRHGEWQISLTDLGVATEEGLLRDLRHAEALWHAGRRDDARARVLELRGPMFRDAPRGQVGRFWSPWTNLTGDPAGWNPNTVAAAFTALADNVANFEAVSPEKLLDYVLDNTVDRRRIEIARQRSRTLFGTEWTDLSTWDRVSHLSPSRIAYTENGGYLLVLAIDRWPIADVDAAFEALLVTIEIEPMPHAVH